MQYHARVVNTKRDKEGSKGERERKKGAGCYNMICVGQHDHGSQHVLLSDIARKAELFTSFLRDEDDEGRKRLHKSMG